MTFPGPMHFAVAMALEDGLEALDAGQTPALPSAIVWSLKLQRDAIERALERDPWGAQPFAAENARAELSRVARLLDALAGKGGVP